MVEAVQEVVTVIFKVLDPDKEGLNQVVFRKPGHGQLGSVSLGGKPEHEQGFYQGGLHVVVPIGVESVHQLLNVLDKRSLQQLFQLVVGPRQQHVEGPQPAIPHPDHQVAVGIIILTSLSSLH